jgi:hypothetical protein
MLNVSASITVIAQIPFAAVLPPTLEMVTSVPSARPCPEDVMTMGEAFVAFVMFGIRILLNWKRYQLALEPVHYGASKTTSRIPRRTRNSPVTMLQMFVCSSAAPAGMSRGSTLDIIPGKSVASATGCAGFGMAYLNWKRFQFAYEIDGPEGIVAILTLDMAVANVQRCS